MHKPVANGNISVFPNPINTGELYFSRQADTYRLIDSRGNVVLEGKHADKISVDGLKKGLYLIIIDGKSKKLVVQ
jgi:hypothetical protein